MENKTGRNPLDVVMELLNHHLIIAHKSGDAVTHDEIEDIYLKYHKLVQENR